MELMNKTRVTDSLAVVIGLESIEVLVTEGFLFDVAIRFVNPNHSYLSQLDVTYKTPDLMSHFLPPHEVSFTFCCSSIVFPR
ncbi:putative glutamine transport system permease protein [Streptococcus pneumoniae]|nr:putative glutamine transport system permease protein [Streptococcus pneumoniae]